MTTTAELAASLLRNAANFFRGVGSQNPTIKEQMDTNAKTYETVAEYLEKDPKGEVSRIPGVANK